MAIQALVGCNEFAIQPTALVDWKCQRVIKFRFNLRKQRGSHMPGLDLSFNIRQGEETGAHGTP